MDDRKRLIELVLTSDVKGWEPIAGGLKFHCNDVTVTYEGEILLSGHDIDAPVGRVKGFYAKLRDQHIGYMLASAIKRFETEPPTPPSGCVK